MGIIELCDAGKLQLLSSTVLLYETQQNPKKVRRLFGLTVLANAEKFVVFDKQIEQRARLIEGYSIKPLDALHLASADVGGADYFCTCDDKFLKRAKNVVDLKVRVVSPLELVEELNDDEH